MHKKSLLTSQAVNCGETPTTSSAYVCVYLYSLDLWGLDNRWLCSLDDTVDLNRLSVGKLYQRYCGTCC